MKKELTRINKSVKLSQMQATVITWILMVVMIVAFMILGCTSCTSSKNVTNQTMEYAMDTIVNKQFIDSVCVADTLASFPNEWIYSPMRSYEEKKDISTYGWMKSSNWTFYRIIKDGDNYRITKRIMK